MMIDIKKSILYNSNIYKKEYWKGNSIIYTISKDYESHHSTGVGNYDNHVRSGRFIEFIKSLRNRKLDRFNKRLMFTVLFAFLVILILPIAIAMITIGALNIDKCKIKPEIPVWLIITGGYLIFLILFASVFYVVKKSACILVPAVITGNLMLIALLIQGLAVVYTIYGSIISKSNMNDDCNQVCFIFSSIVAVVLAVVTVVTYILLSVFYIYKSKSIEI